MTGRIDWIPVDGEERQEERETAPSMDELREFVGGWVELVRILDEEGEYQQMIVNEEGHLVGLAYNGKATEHYRRNVVENTGADPESLPHIVGNAVVLRGQPVWLD